MLFISHAMPAQRQFVLSRRSCLRFEKKVVSSARMETWQIERRPAVCICLLLNMGGMVSWMAIGAFIKLLKSVVKFHPLNASLSEGTVTSALEKPLNLTGL